ncbi:MAG: enoyl-CoA hydratase/isomerase family protein [Balneolaceae bacterium]
MPLKISLNNSVCIATINRAKARNAINFELMDLFESLLDELEKNDDIRVFILTGTGSSFISGGDLREFHQIKEAESARKMGKRMHMILQRIENLPCWTLAAVNGYAYGGGWEIMLAFDFRVAVQHAVFGFTQGKFYLPPGWGGLTRLAYSVGRNRALWLLANQKIIDADEAFRIGLINHIYSEKNFTDSLSELADQLSENDRIYIRHLKEKSLPDQHLFYQRISAELKPFGQFWENEEHIRRVNSFLEKNNRQ